MVQPAAGSSGWLSCLRAPKFAETNFLEHWTSRAGIGVITADNADGMSRVSFTEADVTRALKGAKKAGYSVTRARIVHGTGDIELVFGISDEHTSNGLSDNEWDTPSAYKAKS
jgi:hypothetical protein